MTAHVQRRNGETAPGYRDDGAGITLCSPETFLVLIKRERAVVHRSGGEFGLALWDVGGADVGPSLRRHLLDRIREQMRSVDLAGWVNPTTLGVLLPGTGLAGARTFARRVAAALPASPPPPPWSAYSYPRSFDDGTRQLWEESPDALGVTHGKGGSTTLFSRLFEKPLPAWKRSIDVAGSLLGLLVLLPLFLLVAMYIKLASPGPVFFRQSRIGLGGRTFRFLKFRTMEQGTDTNVHREHLRGLIRGSHAPMAKLDAAADRRVIRGGRILRALSIDELPQLVNVLRGDMSLVGPRPCIPYEAREYRRWYMERFDVTPGMTGLWQVSGKNRLSFDQMIRLDITYAKRVSPALDLAIFARTVPTVAALALESLRRRVHASPSRAVPETAWKAEG